MSDINVKLPNFTCDVQFIKSGQNTDWSHDFYNIKELHEKGRKGKGVKIAVLDTGVDLSHDSFATAIKEGRLKALDARRNQNDPKDRNGHGTWCVSRFISDGKDVLGFAPESTVISIKVLGDNGGGSLTDVMRGIELALEQNVDYISTSLGWGVNVPNFKGLTKKVSESGVLWFSASGNDGTEEDIDFPAKYERVISIGSHNKERRRSSFSDFGVDLDFYSSGQNVLGAYLNNKEAYLSGTSMATPSFAALLSTVHHDIKEKYGKVDKSIIEKLVRCQ